jgi:hypothetical protein
VSMAEIPVAIISSGYSCSLLVNATSIKRQA